MILFKILCGILAAIGMCFGLNYQEISVYLCIHGCPIICILAALVLNIVITSKLVDKCTFFRILLWILSSLWIAFNLLFYSSICQHYSDPAIHHIFNQCVYDFQCIAKECNTTYEHANLIIYTVLFPSIVIGNVFLIYLTKKLLKHGQ